MSRVQLALNVSNIDEAVETYRRLFGTEPAKRRPGYANFAIEDPPLKLVLIEGVGEPGTLNHVGVEVGSTGEVVTESSRLKRGGSSPATKTASPAAMPCRTSSGHRRGQPQWKSTRCSHDPPQSRALLRATVGNRPGVLRPDHVRVLSHHSCDRRVPRPGRSKWRGTRFTVGPMSYFDAMIDAARWGSSPSRRRRSSVTRRAS
jgi:hypothetical protein